MLNILNLPWHTLAFISFIIVLSILFHIKFNAKTATYAPTILTTTGILATFIGIALGLSDFNAKNIQASVPALLAGLKTAFWASVCGVAAALTVKFRHYFVGVKSDPNSSAEDEETIEGLVRALHAIQHSLSGNDDTTVVSQLKMLRQESNDRLDALKKAQLEALERLSQLGSQALIEALEDVIRDFNSKINEQFGDNFKQLNIAVGNMLTWQQEYKKTIEDTTVANRIIADSVSSATDNFKLLLDKAESFTQVANSLSSLLSTLELQRDQITSSLQMLANLLNSASGALPDIENKIVQISSQLAQAVERNQQTISDALSSILSNIQQVVQNTSQETAKAHQEYMRQSTELSTKAKEQISEITQALTASMEQNNDAISGAIAENMTTLKRSIEVSAQEAAKLHQEHVRQSSEMIAKAKEQVQVLDAALAEELQKSLEGLGRQLAALSEKFVNDYTPLTDRLRRLIEIAERV